MSQSPHPLLQDDRTISPAPSRICLLREQHWSFLRKRYRLTLREVQIAQRICAGWNNEEIAVALDIKPGTVKTHLRNIYRKVWVKNKISMLLRFVEDADILAAACS